MRPLTESRFLVRGFEDLPLNSFPDERLFFVEKKNGNIFKKAGRPEDKGVPEGERSSVRSRKIPNLSEGSEKFSPLHVYLSGFPGNLRRISFYVNPHLIKCDGISVKE